MTSDTKDRLLRTGAKIIIRKGFNNTGLKEILDEAGVPKGSFYFYFSSKEDFGLQLIDFYQDAVMVHAMNHLSGHSGPHVEKILRFLDWQGDTMAANGYQGGCPFGILAQEMGDQNEKFRVRIKAFFDQMRKTFAHVLKQARSEGEIDPALDPTALADHILNAWQGTLIQMKLTKNPYSRTIFKHMIFETLMPPSAAKKENA